MTARSPTMVTLHDTRFDECRWWNDGWTEDCRRFDECRWWNDGWTEDCRHLTVVGLHDTALDRPVKVASASI